MRLLASLGLLAGLVAVAACGEVPQTFVDAGTDAAPGTCAPACSSDGTCTNGTCACNAGFTGDGVTCTDVNECQTANGGCDANAVCNNLPGSRSCVCMAGYLGNGVSCRQIWMPVGSFPLVMDPENYGVKAAALGDRIYLHPEVNTLSNVYFRFFDTTNNTLSSGLGLPPNPVTEPPDPNRVSSDFCACGLTDVFVADGNNVYMLGNAGVRYEPSRNVWTTVAAYAGGNERGEAAGSYDPTNNLLLLIGGRTTGSSTPMNASRFTIASQTFGPESGTLIPGADSARAWTLRGSNVTYVAGGDLGGGTTLVEHATGSGQWTLRASAPSNLGRPTGMGEFDGKIWVSTRSAMFFYDPAANTWAPNPFPVPTGFKLAVTASTGTFAFAQDGASTRVYKLLAIQ